jgi:hypothetical protein
MALSPEFVQAHVGFFGPKSPYISPVVSALTDVLIPQAFKSRSFRAYAKPRGVAPRPPSILDFTLTTAYLTLSVAFTMTYAISQRRQRAPILLPCVLKIPTFARVK